MSGGILYSIRPYVAKNGSVGLKWFCGFRMLKVVIIHFCEALGIYFKKLDVANFSFVFSYLILRRNEFLCLNNLCIHSKIIFPTALEAELYQYLDFGHHIIGHLEIVNSKCIDHLILIRHEFLTSKNLCRDTKIIPLTALESDF